MGVVPTSMNIRQRDEEGMLSVLALLVNEGNSTPQSEESFSFVRDVGRGKISIETQISIILVSSF